MAEPDINSSFKKADKTSASDRLQSIRDAFFRNSSLTTQHDFSKGISLKEGGCLLPPPENVMLAMQDSMNDLIAFPYQIYPDQNISEEFIRDIENYFEKNCGITKNENTGTAIGFGSSHIFDGVLSAICKPDSILLAPTAFYHSFADWPTKWGATLEAIETKKENGHKLLASELESWLEKPKNKNKNLSALLLWNPGTTGALYNKQELEDLAKVIKKHDLLVYCDEVFRDTEFGQNKTMSLASLQGMSNHVVTATSGSKNRSVANFRIGWACGPKEIMDEVNHYMDCTITDIPLYLQNIGRAILNTPQSWLDEARAEYEIRANLIAELVAQTNHKLNRHFGTIDHEFMAIPYKPEAGHYCMVNMDGLKGFKTPYGLKIEDGHDLTFFFYDPVRDNDPQKRVAFSSGYSKGHDDLSVYIAFAQLGYEKVTQDYEDYIKRWLLLERLKQDPLFVNVAIDKKAISKPDLDIAYKAGHEIIKEAFSRVYNSICRLEPSMEFRTGIKQKIKKSTACITSSRI